MAEPPMVYEFGHFRLAAAPPRLAFDDEAVEVSESALALLLALVRASPLGLRATQLRLAGDATALDNALQEIRQILARAPDDADLHVDGDGLRFVAPFLLSSDAFGTDVIAADQRQAPPATAAPIQDPSARYEILALLGSGGMGKVYLARDKQLDRHVALKLIAPAMAGNPLWTARFLREARSASALNHPNILTVYDVGQLNGQWYIATEHIDGRPLRAHMGAPLPLETALEFAAQIASALDVAHSAGIVHRDLKPENVMVRSDGILKLLDFGLAKPLRESAADFDGTDPGMVMGTANYMSPEQARGWPVDARTDVFSLGALLYEMLTGAAPFAAPTNSDVIAALLTREPRPLHDIHADLAAAQPLIDLALAKDREQRWPSAKSLLQAIQALRGDRHLERPRVAAPAVRFEAHLQIPEVRYARSGEVNIAYQVIGQAPLDLVFVMGWITHLEYFWTEPSFAQFLRRLATFARVILFDKRGTGLSDRVPLDQLPTLEQRMDDVRAVMEAAGSERAVLCGVSEGGPMCSLFAATYPERTVALVMIGSYARRLRTKDYPWGPSAAERDAFLDQIREHWGQPVGIEERAASVASDPAFRSWWAAYLRRGASPAAAVALTRMNTEIDVRPILPSIRVPTLIVHRSGDRCLQVGEGRYLAEHIPGAKFVELPGIDHLPFVGAQDEILDEIEEFLTGVRHASGFDRVLATVLCAQSVDPSALRAHELLLRKEIELFKGKPMRSDGDVLASFDGPARAVRAACALRAAASRLKIDLRVGVHTGECDVEGERLSGLAVDIASAVAQRATRGVLVSGTVKDLVAGAGIQFDDGNTAELPAPLGAWRLYNVRG